MEHDIERGGIPNRRRSSWKTFIVCAILYTGNLRNLNSLQGRVHNTPPSVHLEYNCDGYITFSGAAIAWYVAQYVLTSHG
jgi:hypothetical protein